MKILSKEYREGHRVGMLSAIHVLKNLSPEGVDFSEAANFLEETQKSVDLAIEQMSKIMERLK